MKWWKKLFISLLVIIILLIGYFIITSIIDHIEETEYNEKEAILQEHLDQDWWLLNNVEIDEHHLWHSPNNSFPGFVRITKTAFILRNSSPIDISSLTIRFDIYDAEGEPYLSKEVKFSPIIKANSIKPIEKYLHDSEFEAIPQGFKWAALWERVEPSPQFVKSKSLEEIKEFVLSDSLSIKTPEIDWEGLTKSLDSLNQTN